MVFGISGDALFSHAQVQQIREVVREELQRALHPPVDDKRARDGFQQRLYSLGYQLEQTNPIFEEMFEMDRDGTLCKIVQTEWLPMITWNRKAEALLAPYKRIPPWE